MATERGWRALELSQDLGQSLLIKCSFSSAGYNVLLTDLSSVWGESLKRVDVLRRATETGSSIDPSEDEAQYSILLDKIKSAISHEQDTAINIYQATGTESLVLRTSSPLPAPLPPLEWQLQLERMPRDVIENELVSPLLMQAHRRKRQIQELIAEIKDKDHVIARLTDKFESSNTDLTTVFPGVSNVKVSRKRSQRSQLARHVKGLTEFDEQAWKDQHASLPDNAKVKSDFLVEMFADLPTAKTGPLPSPDETSSWWQSLPLEHSGHGSGIAGATSARQKPAGSIERPASFEQQENIDDFQTQSTPPHLRRASRIEEAPSIEDATPHHDDAVMKDADDESTTDDDNLDGPAPKTVPGTARAAQTTSGPSSAIEATLPAPKKLGAIGGSTRKVPSMHSEPPPREDSSPEVEEAPSRLAHEPSKPSKGKLGRIGGASKAYSPPDPAPPTLAEPDSPNISSRKLAMIGGKKASNGTESPPSEAPRTVERTPASSSVRKPSPARARSVKTSESSAPRETSQERADRKRDQLRRELEMRAQAPAKKKRKF